MNEDQKKWLLYLQEKGVKFERFSKTLEQWVTAYQSFNLGQEDYRIPSQPIPDIPDWRDVCREMQSKGVKFERDSATFGSWIRDTHSFYLLSELYRIPAKPIPEWKEEMKWSNEEMT